MFVSAEAVSEFRWKYFVAQADVQDVMTLRVPRHTHTGHRRRECLLHLQLRSLCVRQNRNIINMHLHLYCRGE